MMLGPAAATVPNRQTKNIQSLNKDTIENTQKTIALNSWFAKRKGSIKVQDGWVC